MTQSIRAGRRVVAPPGPIVVIAVAGLGAGLGTAAASRLGSVVGWTVALALVNGAGSLASP
jgi:hypothetical protein